MSVTPRVDVAFGSDDAVAAAVRATAARLGIELSAGAPDGVAAATVHGEASADGEAADSADARTGTGEPAAESDAPTRIGDTTLPAGAEPWLFEAALVRATRPAHVLFMCVANSARSQLAHAIGRSVAPEGVRISSAGSEPTSVRPEAITALEEIQIDTTGLRSNGVDDVVRPVDLVVTLCAEEVCPVWLEPARRLHWGMPDPAAVDEGDPVGRMAAFRDVRDELVGRLTVLLGWGDAR